MNLKHLTLAPLAVALVATTSCDGKKDNQLTKAEIEDGWELLFDGETMNGWRDYNGDSLTEP